VIDLLGVSRDGEEPHPIGFKEAYDLTGLGGGAFQDYAYRLGVQLPCCVSLQARFDSADGA
jgi:hypothetical protein